MSRKYQFSHSVIAIGVAFIFAGSPGFSVAATLSDSINATQAANKVATLKAVKRKDWDETHVRRIMQAFAYGGLATDEQIETWAGMRPKKAINQILTFAVNNDRLSPSEDGNAAQCSSLADLQEFWSSDDPDNRMTYPERTRYAQLDSRSQLSNSNLQRTWTKMISTRGCNPFLHKMALFLTNYHASIHIRNTRPALMRDYYDDYVAAMSSGKNFIEIMTVGASHAAVARAYGHQDNRVRNGVFLGNEDFAREYLQLFYGVPGTTEDPEYYETTSIKNNALLLTGMNLDKVQGAYGSVRSYEWYVSSIVFNDHVDNTGRNIRNSTYHYQSELGAESCLEILHAEVCGATAGEKLQDLGYIAGSHPESLANVPVSLVSFFADDNLDAGKIEQIRGSWAAANFDLLSFIRLYASSRAFHDESTFKFFTAFDRNLNIQNASTLDNEENFAKPTYWSPYGRMSDQGVKVFEPIRNVFGHQTGIDAVNNAFIFKDAYTDSTLGNYYHVASAGVYTLEAGGESILWEKDWGGVIPASSDGEYIVADVAQWLWERFIADGGKNFDVIARAQVQSLLATGYDFGYEVDRDNRDPDPFYSSSDIDGGHAMAAQTFTEHAVVSMDFTTKEANERVGLAINFITMTPYAFAMEGK